MLQGAFAQQSHPQLQAYLAQQQQLQQQQQQQQPARQQYRLVQATAAQAPQVSTCAVCRQLAAAAGESACEGRQARRTRVRCVAEVAYVAGRRRCGAPAAVFPFSPNVSNLLLALFSERDAPLC